MREHQALPVLHPHGGLGDKCAPSSPSAGSVCLGCDLIRTRINHKYSCSMKITTCLDHISQCKKASALIIRKRFTLGTDCLCMRPSVDLRCARTRHCRSFMPSGAANHLCLPCIRRTPALEGRVWVCRNHTLEGRTRVRRPLFRAIPSDTRHCRSFMPNGAANH